MFHFQHIVQIYLNTYPMYKQISECLLQKLMLAAVQLTDEQLIAPLYLMRISAKFLHQTCIAGLVKHLPVVTIYWMHLRVNGIWAKSFCPQKTNNRTLFITGCFQR